MHRTSAGPGLPEERHWIGGVSVGSAQYFDVVDPDADEVIARAARGTHAEVDAAVAAASGAWAEWARRPIAARETILARAADLLERDRTEFERLLIREIGSPLRKARGEVDRAIELLRASAGLARQLAGKTPASDVPGRLNLTFRTPVGVVASITPFNVPLSKGVRQTANALALGNAVVLLPSEHAPQVGRRLGALYAAAGVPAGVFNVVLGLGSEIGDALVAHPAVRVVSFTGSPTVGARVGAACGAHLKRAVLELGGKNALVVLDDADVAAAAAAAAASAFTYQGQICMAASRLYVARPVWTAFVERLVAHASALPMGPLTDEETAIGPLISARHRARVAGYLDDAVQRGATVLAGGRWHGRRLGPTVLADVPPGAPAAREEIFGPVAIVEPIDTLEDAIARTNDSPFGLAAAVFTKDLGCAMAYARAARTGMVHINAGTIQAEPHVPFGGLGLSGLGREGTEADLDNLTDWKWVTVQP